MKTTTDYANDNFEPNELPSSEPLDASVDAFDAFQSRNYKWLMDELKSAGIDE